MSNKGLKHTQIMYQLKASDYMSISHAPFSLTFTSDGNKETQQISDTDDYGKKKQYMGFFCTDN